MGTLKIQSAKLQLAHLLLDKSDLSDTEVNILYELMKDADIHAVLDDSNRKFALKIATNGIRI